MAARGSMAFWFACIMCMSSIRHVWSLTCGQSKCDDGQLASCCTLDGVQCCCYPNGSYCFTSSSSGSVSIPTYAIVLIVLVVIGACVGGAIGFWWYKRRNSAGRERF